jgi:hypothetical protein
LTQLEQGPEAIVSIPTRKKKNTRIMEGDLSPARVLPRSRIHRLFNARNVDHSDRAAIKAEPIVTGNVTGDGCEARGFHVQRLGQRDSVIRSEKKKGGVSPALRRLLRECEDYRGATICHALSLIVGIEVADPNAV